MRDFANPGVKPFSTSGAKGDFHARYVRVTATKLAPRKNDFIFALAEMQVLDEKQARISRLKRKSARWTASKPRRDGRRRTLWTAELPFSRIPAAATSPA